MILIISSISSFEMTKMIPLPALTIPFPLIFIWIAPSIGEGDVMVANGANEF